MDVTATVDTALWAVKLTAANASGTVTWLRRVGGRDHNIGTGATVWDYSPPLNRPITYIATDDTSSAVTQQVTVAADGPILSSTISPIAYPVTVVDYRPLRGIAATVWHPVLGRNDPVVTIHPALYPSGLLRLYMATATVRVQLIELLTLGEPLVLRTTCTDRVDNMTFVMTEWEDPFVNDRRKGPPAYLDITFQQVTDEIGAPIPIPDRTYQTWVDDHPTYQALFDAYPDYRAALDGPTP